MADAEDQARYEAAKKELIQALAKKRALDKELSRLEVQIYHTEATYLTETSAQGAGNIIQGFDNYLKNPTVTRRRNEVTDADRMFSNSSATYQRSLELAGDGDDSAPEDRPGSATGLTTITLAPARGTELTAAQQNKKQRDRDYQRKKRASNRQRSTTGVESDEESVSTASGRQANKRRRMADDD